MYVYMYSTESTYFNLTSEGDFKKKKTRIYTFNPHLSPIDLAALDAVISL